MNNEIIKNNNQILDMVKKVFVSIQKTIDNKENIDFDKIVSEFNETAKKCNKLKNTQFFGIDISFFKSLTINEYSEQAMLPYGISFRNLKLSTKKDGNQTHFTISQEFQRDDVLKILSLINMEMKNDSFNLTNKSYDKKTKTYTFNAGEFISITLKETDKKDKYSKQIIYESNIKISFLNTVKIPCEIRQKYYDMSTDYLVEDLENYPSKSDVVLFTRLYFIFVIGTDEKELHNNNSAFLGISHYDKIIK